MLSFTCFGRPNVVPQCLTSSAWYSQPPQPASPVLRPGLRLQRCSETVGYGWSLIHWHDCSVSLWESEINFYCQAQVQVGWRSGEGQCFWFMLWVVCWSVIAYLWCGPPAMAWQRVNYNISEASSKVFCWAAGWHGLGNVETEVGLGSDIEVRL